MARELAARGHTVHVITGFPNYPTGVLADGFHQKLRYREVIGGVHVVRVPLFVNHDRSAVHRIMNYLSFGLSATFLGVPALPPIDVLWVNYSPITVAFPMWLQRHLHRTPTVCEVGDLWPDTIAVSGLEGASFVGKIVGRLLGRWCNAMYSNSEAVVHISPGVGNLLRCRGVPEDKLHYIPKPANEAATTRGGRSFRAALMINPDQVVLLYAGAMGAAQNLGALVEACSIVDDPRLVVLLAGSGSEEDELRSAVTESGLTSIRFLGRLPQEVMADLLVAADAAFISLAAHPLSAATMPSKTQQILASGRAILVAGLGDVAALVEENGVGFTARPGDPESIAAGLTALLRADRGQLAAMGLAARSLYTSQFSVKRTSDQVEELLAMVIRTSPWALKHHGTPTAAGRVHG